MKKIFYPLLSICAVGAIAVSCEKEADLSSETVRNSDTLTPSVITCEINPDDVTTRTQYAGNTTFGWTQNDWVRLATINGSSWGFSTYQTTDASGSTSATFGELDTTTRADASGYAIYPWSIYNFTGWAASGTWDDQSGHPLVNLPNSIAYNSATPLDGGVIPLIGKKVGSTYKFSTAVGIIKLTLAQSSTAIKKVKLVSSDKPLAGKFAVSDVDTNVSQVANTSGREGETSNEITLTGLTLTAGESYDFYFPVPVGDYSASSLSVQFLDNSDNVLLKKTIAKSLSIARNEVLSIPSLVYHRVEVNTTNPYHPSLFVEYPTGASRILVHVSDAKLTAANYTTQWTNSKDGNRFNGAVSAWDITTLSDKNGSSFFSDSGTYYLQYIFVNSGDSKPSTLSDSRVMVYGSVPFTYSAPTNRLTVASEWLNVPYISTSEGESASYLVDRNWNGAYGTYWHSPYGSEDPARNATYGQIISVDLSQGSLTTDGNFDFAFCTRNGALSNHSKAINIYVSTVRWDDSSFAENKVLVGSTENALTGITPSAGQWVAPISCSGSGTYSFITISILSNSAGNDLRTSGCTHMAEIEFYTK